MFLKKSNEWFGKSCHKKKRKKGGGAKKPAHLDETRVNSLAEIRELLASGDNVSGASGLDLGGAGGADDAEGGGADSHGHFCL